MRIRRLLGWSAVSAALVMGCSAEGGEVPVDPSFPEQAGSGFVCPPSDAVGAGGRGGGGAVWPQFSSFPVVADKAPPPISGGTLHASSDGSTLIAADPDRDAVYVIDATTRSLVRRIELQPGDEPGRVTEDKHGNFHV